MADSKTFKEIFALYAIEGAVSAAPAAQPADPNAGSNVSQPTVIPSWKIPIEAIKAAENAEYKSLSGAPTVTDIELSKDEYAARNWVEQNVQGEPVAALEYTRLGPDALKLARGFRPPYVKRLDKKDAQHKKIIDGIKAIRALLPVPSGFDWTTWGEASNGPKVPKVGYGWGWMYGPPKGSPYAQWLGKTVVSALTSSIAAGTLTGALTAAKTMLLEGGGPSSMGTYDGNVLTMGIGHAMGAHKPWKRARDVNEKAKAIIDRAFELCGISVEFESREDTWIGTYQIVDLSDDDNPMVVYTDEYFHGYGWWRQGADWQRVRPRYPVTSIDELSTDKGDAAIDKLHDSLKSPSGKAYFPGGRASGGTLSSLRGAMAPVYTGTGGYPPAGYRALKYTTNKAKKDVEVLYAYIAIAEDPDIRQFPFAGNWDRKVADNVLKPPFDTLTEIASMYIGTISHETGLSLSKMSPDLFLSKDDRDVRVACKAMASGGARGGQVRDNSGVLTMAMAKAPASPDEARAISDALLCKAIVRAAACMWENDRVAEAIKVFKKKNIKVDLYADDVFSYARMWRFMTARDRWAEMVSGKMISSTLQGVVSASGQPAPPELKALIDTPLKPVWSKFEDANGKLEFNIKSAHDNQQELKGMGNVAWHPSDLYGYPYGRSVSSYLFLLGPMTVMAKLPQVSKELAWNCSLAGVDFNGPNGAPSRLHFEGAGLKKDYDLSKDGVLTPVPTP